MSFYDSDALETLYAFAGQLKIWLPITTAHWLLACIFRRLVCVMQGQCWCDVCGLSCSRTQILYDMEFKNVLVRVKILLKSALKKKTIRELLPFFYFSCHIFGNPVRQYLNLFFRSQRLHNVSTIFIVLLLLVLYIVELSDFIWSHQGGVDPSHCAFAWRSFIWFRYFKRSTALISFTKGFLCFQNTRDTKWQQFLVDFLAKFNKHWSYISISYGILIWNRHQTAHISRPHQPLTLL